jgi:hypothetical protein
MTTTVYRLISARELGAFNDALRRQGYQPDDFELQEDVFDQNKAEVEAALGEVGVRCLTTQAVVTYPLGQGVDWVAQFEDELRQGRMGGRRKGQG